MLYHLKSWALIFSLILQLIPLTMQAKAITPAPLQAGDTVALISPSHLITHEKMQFSKERLQALGLNVIVPKTLLETYGHFAGTPQSRAKEINDLFKNKQVKGLFAVRGGSGAGNILPFLDYQLIKANPKVLMGYSDVTALLIAILSQSELMTYHGPVVGAAIPEFSADYIKAVLFQLESKVIFSNPVGFNHENDLIQTEDRITTIHPGNASGKLIGGNLSVLTSMLGTPYLPKDWHDVILFLEDVSEEVYRIDVMLGQLENAGILKQIKGFVFGTCAECEDNTKNAFQLHEVLNRYIKPLNIPAYSGALIGHQPEQFTLPVGAVVQMNATEGTISWR